MILTLIKNKLYEYVIERIFNQVGFNFRVPVNYDGYFKKGEKYSEIHSTYGVYEDVTIKGYGRLICPSGEPASYVLVWAVWIDGKIKTSASIIFLNTITKVVK